MTSIRDPEATVVGLDVHKDTISAGVIEAGSDSPMVDRIWHDEPSVRRLFAAFPQPARLRACYEAGPTGYAIPLQDLRRARKSWKGGSGGGNCVGGGEGGLPDV